jgi:hypothetical protein
VAAIPAERQDEVYIGACDRLAARPLERELLATDAGIAEATDPQQRRALVERKAALMDRLRKEHPSASQRYGYRRLYRRARRT